MNFSKLVLSFLIIILMGMSATFYTVNKMWELSEHTKSMYTHSLNIAKNVSQIHTSIVKIHKKMKEIELSQTQSELITLIEEIQEEEDRVYKKFDAIYRNYLGNRRNIDTSFKLFKQWKKIRNELILNREPSSNIKDHEHIKNLYYQIDLLEDLVNKEADSFYRKSLEESGIEKVIAVIAIAGIVSGLVILFVLSILFKANRKSHHQLFLIDQNILTAKFTLNKKVIDISSALCRVLDLKKADVIGKRYEYLFTTEEQYNSLENCIYSGKEFSGEVYIYIHGEKVWFEAEIIPELNSNYDITSFSLFLTNISDKKKIEEVSITDSLTQLYNRNYFDMVFEKEVNRAKRDNKKLSIVIFDIDFFKQYNDTYGHLEGDNALKAVANTLKNYTNRSSDYAFRFGGEEFIIVANHENIEKAKEFTEEILFSIRSLKIPHKSSLVSEFITISAGCGFFEPTHTMSYNEMFQKVDHLLYEAKGAGRDRCAFCFIE